MKTLKQRLWQRATVATVTGLGVALAMVGSAKPAAASFVDWGLTIHIGGHDGDHRYRDRDDYRYHDRDDYRYRRDYDDYRYRPQYDIYGYGGYVHRDRDDYRYRDRDDYRHRR